MKCHRRRTRCAHFQSRLVPRLLAWDKSGNLELPPEHDSWEPRFSLPRTIPDTVRAYESGESTLHKVTAGVHVLVVNENDGVI